MEFIGEFEDGMNTKARGGTVHINDGFCKLEDSGGHIRYCLSVFCVDRSCVSPRLYGQHCSNCCAAIVLSDIPLALSHQITRRHFLTLLLTNHIRTRALFLE